MPAVVPRATVAAMPRLPTAAKEARAGDGASFRLMPFSGVENTSAAAFSLSHWHLGWLVRRRAPRIQLFLNQLYKPCINLKGSSANLEGLIMILRRFTLAMFLLTAPAVWGQYNRADMMKLATDRCDTVAKKLNLNPSQITAIRPLLQSKYIDMGQVKDVYSASDKSDTAKKTAKDSLRAIHDKYNAKISAILSPEQSKAWKRMQKDWKDDLSMPKS
jgi:hypothetical protein